MVNLGWVDLELSSFFFSFGHVDRKGRSQERQESWQDHTTVHVAITRNPDSVFFLIVLETRVLVAPALQVVVISLDWTTLVVVNDLGVCLPVNSDLLGGNKLFVGVELLVYLV